MTISSADSSSVRWTLGVNFFFQLKNVGMFFFHRQELTRQRLSTAKKPQKNRNIRLNLRTLFKNLSNKTRF